MPTLKQNKAKPKDLKADNKKEDEFSSSFYFAIIVLPDFELHLQRV